MTPLIECVPNFSEGRRPHVVDALAAAVASVPGVTLLDASLDPDHHRSVLTFAGPPPAVAGAAVQAAGAALRLIDLRQHQGVHPRLGALDVLPFVPLRGISLDACANLARAAAQRIFDEHRIPAYLYEAAALRPQCANLADVRRLAPALPPDIGTPHLHPTAGALACGARPLLVAFNVHLRDAPLAAARDIARSVRYSSGGLPGVKALGLWLASRSLAQVSMNLTRLAQTPLLDAFLAVEREAAARGIEILDSELIGLAPQAVLTPDIAARVRLRHFHPGMILENRLAIPTLPLD